MREVVRVCECGVVVGVMAVDVEAFRVRAKVEFRISWEAAKFTTRNFYS